MQSPRGEKKHKKKPSSSQLWVLETPTLGPKGEILEKVPFQWEHPPLGLVSRTKARTLCS